MSLKFVATKNAPGAVGPYSQGTVGGNVIFTSGQLPMAPDATELISGDIVKATRKCLENVLAIVEEAGGKKENIAKVTVFVTDIGQFGAINEEYAKFFGDHKPARSLMEVVNLPKGAEIEIEAIAIL